MEEQKLLEKRIKAMEKVLANKSTNLDKTQGMEIRTMPKRYGKHRGEEPTLRRS